MGQTAAETVREIEQTRERLDAEVHELQGRLPAPIALAKRAVGVLVGGGVSGSVAWFAIKRVRKQRSKKTARPVPVEQVIRLVPDRWAKAFDDGNVRSWALGMGSALVVLQLAELRRLRSLNKALAGRI